MRIPKLAKSYCLDRINQKSSKIFQNENKVSYLARVFASFVQESSAHHGWVDLVSVVWVGVTVVVGDDWDGDLSEGVGDGA